MKRVTLGLALLAAGCAVSPPPRPLGYQTSDAAVSVTRLVHGSVIVGLRQTRLLVDPWFYPRWMFRQTEPLGLLPDRLPPLAAIVITRDGARTLDGAALRALAKQVPLAIAPPEAHEQMRAFGFTTVRSADAGAPAVVGPVTVDSVADGGYLLSEDATRVYLACDPPDPTTITGDALRHGPLTVALLPIGGPRLFGLARGLTPEAAGTWAKELQADRSIPYRYGLGGGAPWWSFADGPTARFAKAARGVRVVVLQTGDGWHHNP